MTNCNSQKFPSTCNPADYGFKKFFPHTGEEVYYQKITGSNLPEDGIVFIKENGECYKAILNENTINIEWYRCSPSYPNDEAMITQAIQTAAYLGATLRFDAREYIVNKQLEFQTSLVSSCWGTNNVQSLNQIVSNVSVHISYISQIATTSLLKG
jgi:hypothetical protein